MPKKGRRSKKDINELIDILVYLVFAAVVLPIIATQLNALEGDTGNYSAAEILIIGVIMTFVILGIAYQIYQKMF